MYIHILEDDAKQRTEIEQRITKVIKKNKYKMEIGVSCGNPDKFLELTKSYPQSVFILDVVLETDMTGLDVAKIIRETRVCHDFLIIITSELDFMHLALSYNIEVMNFIFKKEKDKIDSQLESSMMMVQRKMNEKEKKNIYLKYRGILIQQEKVLYIQTVHEEKNKVELIDTDNDKHTLRGSLKDIWNEGGLDNRFYFINRSVIINLQHVEHCDKEKSIVRLKKGYEFPVSFRNRSGLLRKLKKFT